LNIPRWPVLFTLIWGLLEKAPGVVKKSEQTDAKGNNQAEESCQSFALARF